MSVEIVMPQLGQAMVSGVVVAWHAADGDHVQAGAPLLTIESDKSAFDIEAPAAGLLKRRVSEGEEADVGSVLGVIGAENDLPPPVARNPDKIVAGENPAAPAARGETEVRASPRARAAARGKIDLTEVKPGSEGGMISADDVERAIARRAVSVRPDSHIRIVEGRAQGKPIGSAHMSAIRRLQQSWAQAPHIVQMVTVDATRLVQAQALIRSGALNASLNDIIIKAAADTMAEFPDLNASVQGEQLVVADQVDVSIAVATDRGLRTPIIRDVAGLPLERVAERSREAIDAARQGRSVAGRASLTISNLGRHGIQFGTPVLNLDESVLIFVGEISERPRVVAGAIEVGHELYLSIAYDHRVTDGLRAAEFTSSLRRRLAEVALGPEGISSPIEPRTVSVVARGLACEAKDGAGHRWVIDEPDSIGGTDRGPDPVTSALGALLSCLMIAFRLVANRRGVPIDQLSGTISSPDQGKVSRIAITLQVESDAEAEKVRSLLKPAKNACYVHAMLNPEIDIAIALEVQGGVTS